MDSKWFQFYGAKGIKCHLNAAQMKEIWERDNAHLLKKPSLDRIDSRFDYANWNVRVIEFVDNSRLAWDESFRFLYNQRDEEARQPEVAAPQEDYT